MSGDIEPVVRSLIEVKIVEAFRDTPEMVDDLVKAVLEEEVYSDGSTRSEYRFREEKMPYLTYLARSTIQNVASRAVESFIEEMESDIQGAIQEQLKAEDVVKAFTQEVVKATAESWRLKVNVLFDKSEK